jgi:hypothetical protein
MELQVFSGPGFSDFPNFGNKPDETAENRMYLPVRMKMVTRIVKLGRKKAVITSNEYRSLYVSNDPNMQLLLLVNSAKIRFLRDKELTSSYYFYS